jgi:hypothetical protein
MEEVQGHFAQAVKLGSSNPRMYYDYARMSSGREAGAESIPLLQKAVQLQPEFKEARIALAGALYNTHQYGSAVASLNPLPPLTHDEAVRVLRMLGYAYSELGQDEAARKSVEQLQKLSKTPEEVAVALDLLRYVNRPRRVAPEPQSGQQQGQRDSTLASSGKNDGDPEAPPRLQRRETVKSEILERTEQGLPRTRVEGTLYQFDCLGKMERLTILVAGKRVALAIEDPTKILIGGTGGDTFDFTCGRQQPSPVVVQFENKVDGELGTVGVVRAIEFK